jgi:hypothetical protein
MENLRYPYMIGACYVKRLPRHRKSETMMLPSTLVIVAILALTAPAMAQNPCGISPTDWCPAPPGDACGRHLNKAACQADPKCYGMPYRGVSMIACIPEARGFSSNCPTVGCIGTPPNRHR